MPEALQEGKNVQRRAAFFNGEVVKPDHAVNGRDAITVRPEHFI